jgi:4-amino-4-deoxy-L-arabinose transferase-like glycosyltransferase
VADKRRRERRTVVAVIHSGLPIDNEGAEYARLADNLRAGAGYVDLRGVFRAHDPPLYPLLIALVAPVLRDTELAGRLISLVFGSLMIVPVYALARQAYGNRVAACAGFLAAIYPFFIVNATSVLSETLFTALAFGGAALVLRALTQRSSRIAAASGVLFGFSYLTQQESIIWMCLAVAVAFWVTYRQERRLRVAALRCCAVLLPFIVIATLYWTVVARETGHFTAANSRSGNWVEGVRIMNGMSFEKAALLLGPHLEPLGPELSNYPFPKPYAGPHSIAEAVRWTAYAAVHHAREIFWYLRQPEFGSGALLVGALAGFVLPPWTARRRALEAFFVVSMLVIFTALLFPMLLEPRSLVAFVSFLLLWTARGLCLTIDACAMRFGRATVSRQQSFGLPVTGIAVTIAVLATFGFAGRAEAAGRLHTGIERRAGAWIARHLPGALVMDQGSATPYYAHASRWLTLPWGNNALVLRYIHQQRPGVIVIIASQADQLPYLRRWLRRGIPDRLARRIATLHQGGDTAVIYDFVQPPA